MRVSVGELVAAASPSAQQRAHAPELASVTLIGAANSDPRPFKRRRCPLSPSRHLSRMRRRPQIVWKAAALLAAGTAICAVISDPLVEAVSSFSKVTRPSATTQGLRPRDAPASNTLLSVPQAAFLLA